MLDLSRIKIVVSREMSVVAGESVNQEGMSLIQVLENGEAKVKPSNGSTNAKFAGFSYGQPMTPLVLSMAEEIILGSGVSSGELLKTPLANQISVYNKTAGSYLSPGDPNSYPDTFSVSGNILTVNLSDAGTILVVYRYSPTTLEVYELGNMSYTSLNPADYIGSVGVIMEGEVFTDQFDASGKWYTTDSVKAGANGLLVDGDGTGTTIGAKIISVPTVDNPFLGIRFSAM